MRSRLRHAFPSFFATFASSAVKILGDFSNIFAPPPGLFRDFIANKGPYANRRLGDPCVALGPRLGGPWVAQGPPKPNPKQAEGRKLFPSTKYQLPTTVFLSKIIFPPPGQRLQKNTSDLQHIVSLFVRFCQGKLC
jgi:hypothetical protein